MSRGQTWPDVLPPCVPGRLVRSLGEARRLVMILLLAALASCSPPPGTSATQGILKADFAQALKDSQRWAQRETGSPIPRFASSVCLYFLKDADAAFSERQAALSSKENAALVAAWAQDTAASSPDTAMGSFLKAVAAELKGDPKEAVKSYSRAETADPGNVLFHYSRIAAEDGAAWVAEVPKDQPLSYKGEMKLVANVWIPVEGKFQVTGGTLRTQLGDVARTATFGNWKPLVAIETKQAVAWAALLTRGEMIVSSEQVATAESAGRVALGVECAVKKSAFDYLGKYFIVALDEPKNLTYPLIPVPFYMPDGDTWDGRLVLGTEISIDPENFQRIRSWGQNRNAVIMQEEANIYHGEGDTGGFGGMMVMEGHRQTLFGNLRIEVSSGKLSGPVVRASRL